MHPSPTVAVRSTNSVPGAERFSYWADVVTQTFVPLECDAPNRQHFRGEVRHRQIGNVGISDVRASAMRAGRTPATISRAPHDELIAVLHLDGISQTGQGSDRAVLGPGSGAVVTTDEPYFFQFPHPFRQLVLKMPRGLLPGARIRGGRPQSLSLAAGPAHLLQSLVLSSLDEPLAFSADEEIGIERAFAELFRAASFPTDSDRARRAEAPQYSHACLFIRAHLADPALKPAAVAAETKMSTRNLARLFARHGTTVERAIWRERLSAAHRDLLDPRLVERSITDIAFSWAFNDAAHFSRSFAKAYGIAPSALRAASKRPLPRTSG